MNAETTPTRSKVYYLRDTLAPFEEDETHEFKAHTNLCAEEIPDNCWMPGTDKRSRQPISRNLNGYLNSGLGGTVYIGITDEGVIKGLQLTQYTKDHLVTAVDDLMTRYIPPVESHRYKVEFVPVVDKESKEEERMQIVHYDSQQRADPERRKQNHLLRQQHYCWCHKDAVAQLNMGVLPAEYIAEITILPWDPEDSRNKNAVGEMRTYPFHQDEEGRTYFRSVGCVTQYTTQEMVMISRQIVVKHYEEKRKKLEVRKKQLLEEILKKVQQS